MPFEITRTFLAFSKSSSYKDLQFSAHFNISENLKLLIEAWTSIFISRQDEFSSLSFVVSDFKIKNCVEKESIEISLHESNSNDGYPRYPGSFELYIDINFSQNVLNKKDWETNQKYLNLAQEVLNN